MTKNREKCVYGFMDESGAPGVASGANDFLVVSAVMFENEEEMKKVRCGLMALRHKLGLRQDYEFHFAHNNRRVRSEAIVAMSELDFNFMTFAIAKTEAKKRASYANMAQMIVRELSKDYRCKMRIMLDTNSALHRELNKAKKEAEVNDITFREGDSIRNDTLQVADYVVGMHSKLIKTGKSEGFRRIKEKMIRLEVDEL